MSDVRQAVEDAVAAIEALVDAGERIPAPLLSRIMLVLGRTGQLPEELSIDLRKPIEWAGDPVTKLNLREPSAGDIEHWDKLNGAAADIKAVSIMAGVTESVARKIPASEFYQATRYIAAFLS